MAIVPGKTNTGLVKHAERALREKWWYMWGTFGNYLTQPLLDSKAAQYPYYNRDNGMYATHKKHLGQTVSDCVGLIKGYCMWDEETGLTEVQSCLGREYRRYVQQSNRKRSHFQYSRNPRALRLHERTHRRIYRQWLGN